MILWTQTDPGGGMDLRVLVLMSDDHLATMVRSQVDNLGCTCSVAPTYEDAAPALGWADAAIVDLADGWDDVARLGEDAPRVRVLAIAPDDQAAEVARRAGADHVLLEPFSIPALVDAVRALAPEPPVIDLRAGETAPVEDDAAPWWASR